MDAERIREAKSRLEPYDDNDYNKASNQQKSERYLLIRLG